MGLSASRSTKPFELEEFKVAWLAFKAEITETGSRDRGLASKRGLASSKFLRSLYGESMVDEMKGLPDDLISREYFIGTLALFYQGNTEDKIGYVFSMYGVTRDDGVINYNDYLNLLEYLTSHQSVAPELANVFDDCDLSKDAYLQASTFLKWVRQYPHVMEALATLLPATSVDDENVVDDVALAAPIPSHVAHEDTDPLNVSPSFKYANERRLKNLSSFEILGGDSSEDSSADSDVELHGDAVDDKPRSSSPPLRPSLPRDTDTVDDRTASAPMPRTHDRKGRNPIGKLGRAVGGGISKVGRSILPKGKKGVAYATATAGGSTENHHYIGGYLHKISDGKWSKRVWHTRWFVLDLERGVLSYYKANPSSSINSPHGSVAFYDDLDLHLHVGDDARASHHHSQHPVVHKPHPWFRGCMDLNQTNVSLLFEKQFAQNAPNQYFFQVSNLNIGESESKRGSQYKLCANTEEEFMQWTNAIADVINRKHTTGKAEPQSNLSIQQIYRQRLQESSIHEAPEEAPVETEPAERDSEPVRRSSVRVSTSSSNATPTPQPSPTKPPLHPPTPVPPIVPPRAYSEMTPVAWRFAFAIEGQRDCLLFLCLLNFAVFSSFAAFGRSGQLFVMVLISLGFLRSLRSPSHLAPVALSVDDDDVPPCVASGVCCLHAPPAAVAVSSLPFLAPVVVPAPAPTHRKFSFDMFSSFKQSTNDDCAENAWSFTTAETFNVRSLDYKKSKKKEASASALFDFVGADLVRSDAKIDCITQHVNLPPHLTGEKLFVINAQLPLYGPSIFGGGNYDGPGVNLALYWTIPKDVQAQLVSPSTPTLRLLKRFFNSAKDPSILDRFKVIAQVVNEKDCGLSGMPRKLLQKNNATPVLTRPQHRIYHREHFTEIDVDVHMFSLVARTGINSLVDKTAKMVIDMCFVLQGETDDELPEHILGCARMVRVDLSSAKHLDQVIHVTSLSS
ncbi:hypothetical protein, variant [Saprolegnia diclina VS20]|uniref:PH domain-containing protein n=1 Tax=Saprolegnia diclina (strain VS20) TaxID=1156394 RepID=T0Q207_SAPDV|nr:hypothetical protein, variant [Saprolegnia diclina VS20]EQC31869.1 hypothetical protein, variant [Saprolegnia diclina VS20]|eukprot:XP_008614596.1 hypothetical protein, variant [Saprolegnia diclina VS20]